MEKIDLKSVKIALNRDEMEEIVGGSGLNCSDALALGALSMVLVGTGPLGWVAVAGFMLACH